MAQDEIIYVDKFGEQRTLHRTPYGIRHKRTEPSPVITLNREIGILVRLAPRIWDLKAAGHPIVAGTKSVTARNGRKAHVAI